MVQKQPWSQFQRELPEMSLVIGTIRIRVSLLRGPHLFGYLLSDGFIKRSLQLTCRHLEGKATAFCSTAPWDELSDIPVIRSWSHLCKRAWHRQEADGNFEMSFAVVIVNEQKGRTRKETFMSPFSSLFGWQRGPQ